MSNSKVCSVKQSPLNPVRWCLLLSCGHDEWVTAKRRPTRKTYRCTKCRPNRAFVKQKRQMCESCGKNPADLPSPLCVGCEAYQEHQR